jgi:hypothetical protein
MTALAQFEISGDDLSDILVLRDLVTISRAERTIYDHSLTSSLDGSELVTAVYISGVVAAVARQVGIVIVTHMKSKRSRLVIRKGKTEIEFVGPLSEAEGGHLLEEIERISDS